MSKTHVEVSAAAIDRLSIVSCRALEGARVTAQSIGRDGLGDRLIRMGEAMIAAHER